MSESTPSTLVCTPWAGEEDILALPNIDLGDVPQDSGMITDALAVASDILYALTGRRWRGAGCTRTVTLEARPWSPPPGLVGRHLVDVAAARLLLGRIGDVHPLWLPDYPVTEITAIVDANDAAVDPSLWRLVDGRRVDRIDSAGSRTQWPCSDFTVTYEYGQAPPIGGVRAAAVLAAQLCLAACGSKECRLPDRTTQVNRQGVSVTVLDPLEFIEKGQTGLPEVDLWIASVNPHGTRSRPAVWSPDVETRNATYGGTA